ncbi:MAG: ABC transporter permease [Planctomycetes bacterium]|nr:ABC transporter permease [Planctomycetota bacterium]
MSKIFYIAKREYRATVRTRAFLVSLILMPIFMAGGGLAQKFLEGRVDLETQRMVVVDPTGKILPALVTDAERRNKEDIFDSSTGRQVDPKFIIEAGPSDVLTDEQRLDLSDQVRQRRIFAFVEINSDIFKADRANPHAIDASFYSESAVSNDLNRWFTGVLNRTVQAEKLRAAGLDPVVVNKAVARVNIDVFGLYARGRNGEIRKADEVSRKAAIFVPMGVMMLMFMSLMMSQAMLQNVLEEKQQKITEVLLGSVRPFELMMGKLVGNVGVSVTMVALWLSGGFYMLHRAGYGDLLRNELIVWFLAYQIIGVLIYGSIFVAIGALCNELREAQNYLMPVMLILVLPMMVWFKVLEEPMSNFATGLSLFPPCTPMLMILRMSATAAVPIWQPIAGIAGTLAMTVACVWVAGRIFRVGLLMQGKPPKLTDLMRFAIKG